MELIIIFVVIVGALLFHARGNAPGWTAVLKGCAAWTFGIGAVVVPVSALVGFLAEQSDSSQGPHGLLLVGVPVLGIMVSILGGAVAANRSLDRRARGRADNGGPAS